MCLQLPSANIEAKLQGWHDSKPLELEFLPKGSSFSYSTISLFLDYAPGFSALVSIFKGLGKWLYPNRNSWEGEILPRFNCLTRESRGYWRHITVSVPVLGNVMIAVCDLYAKIKAEKILKAIPEGNNLSNENIEALKLAAAYGSSEALVRLAQFYFWHGCTKDVGNGAAQLMREAAFHGHTEAQEWIANYSSVFWRLHAMKEEKEKIGLYSQYYEYTFEVVIDLAEQWSPELQKQLPIFEEVSQVCIKYPNVQTMALLKKLCDKVEKNHTCDTAQVREKIATFEKENLDGTVVSLE